MQNLTDIQKGKTPAIVAYLTFIGWLIAFFMNKEPKSDFAAFHLRQAMGIHLLALILNYTVSWLDSWLFTWLVWAFLFVLWLIAFIGSIQGQRKLVPFFGEYFEKWFSTITE
jgi:uncharacterized membrane protein